MMRAAFHKGGGKWSFISWIIRKWTRGPYSHVELMFSDGISFSSRKEGVGFKLIDYLRHPDRWDFLELPYGQMQESVIREHGKTHCGERYDWIGIFFDRVFKTSVHGENLWWCSEIVAHVLGIEPEMVDPTQLHKAITSNMKNAGKIPDEQINPYDVFIYEDRPN